MARPIVPDSDKKRTVPLRLTKPQYRALSALESITGITIQEQLRQATRTHLQTMREELRRDQIDFPSEYWLGEMSDAAFEQWLRSSGSRPKEPQRRRGLRMAQPTAAA